MRFARFLFVSDEIRFLNRWNLVLFRRDLRFRQRDLAFRQRDLSFRNDICFFIDEICHFKTMRSAFGRRNLLSVDETYLLSTEPTSLSLPFSRQC